MSMYLHVTSWYTHMDLLYQSLDLKKKDLPISSTYNELKHVFMSHPPNTYRYSPTKLAECARKGREGHLP